MPRAAGASELCEKTLAELEQEFDSLFDEMVSGADSGRGFRRAMEKIEGDIEAARKLALVERDLELNEAAVIADKLDGELEAAAKLAAGAALAETEEEWAASLEDARGSLDAMRLHMRGMRGGGRPSDGSALEARNALASFRRESAKCSETLSKIHRRLAAKSHPAFSRVELARKKLKSLRVGVGRTFSKISKVRLRKKIDESKGQIAAFLSGTHSARVFIDHKHLTLQAGAHKAHMPLTQAVRFALEEIAPIERPLAMLGRRGTVLTGSYEKDGRRGTLRLGERCVSGDAIIYRERTYSVEI